MREVKEEFQNELKIDKDSLDDECLNQSILFAKWSLMAVNAVDEKDRNKEKVDLIKSQLDKKIRENPADFGLDSDKKPTETAILNCILIQNEYRSIYNEYLASLNQANVLFVAKEAFQMRRYMLEKIVDLYQSNYFASPKIKPETKERIFKKAQIKMKESLNQ